MQLKFSSSEFTLSTQHPQAESLLFIRVLRSSFLHVIILRQRFSTKVLHQLQNPPAPVPGGWSPSSVLSYSALTLESLAHLITIGVDIPVGIWASRVSPCFVRSAARTQSTNPVAFACPGCTFTLAYHSGHRNRRWTMTSAPFECSKDS